MDTSREREQAFILTFEKAFNPEMEAETIYEYAVSNEVIEKLYIRAFQRGLQ